MTRKPISQLTYRLLFAHCGNKCAFETCSNPIFEDDGTLTGECCHIHAYSKSGPRYDPMQTDEDRNGYDNLILLCSRHHKIIDSNSILYTADYLRSLKKKHEKEFTAEDRKLSNQMLAEFQTASQVYEKRINQYNQQIKTNEYKITIDPSQDTLSVYNTLIEQFQYIENFLELLHSADEKCESDLTQFLQTLKCGIDFEIIPYYENPFVLRNWDLHNIFIPNKLSEIHLHFMQLKVKILEHMQLANLQDRLIAAELDKSRQDLERYHNGLSYID